MSIIITTSWNVWIFEKSLYLLYIYICRLLTRIAQVDWFISSKTIAGKRLGERGLDWLKIHLVNLSGAKKRESNATRLAYADEVLPLAFQSADDPLKVRDATPKRKQSRDYMSWSYVLFNLFSWSYVFNLLSWSYVLFNLLTWNCILFNLLSWSYVLVNLLSWSYVLFNLFMSWSYVLFSSK